MVAEPLFWIGFVMGFCFCPLWIDFMVSMLGDCRD